MVQRLSERVLHVDRVYRRVPAGRKHVSDVQLHQVSQWLQLRIRRVSGRLLCFFGVRVLPQRISMVLKFKFMYRERLAVRRRHQHVSVRPVLVREHQFMQADQ